MGDARAGRTVKQANDEAGKQSERSIVFIQRAGRVSIGVAAMFATGACNEWTSPDENVVTISANRLTADSAQTFATLEMPGVSQALNEVQLSARAQFVVRGKKGTIRVSFVRVKGVADTIGRGEISFEIVKGYTYYADFMRDRPNTLSPCFGCGGSKTFPMIGSAQASTDVMRLNYVYGLPLCRGCVTQRSEGARMLARGE